MIRDRQIILVWIYRYFSTLDHAGEGGKLTRSD